MPVVRSGPWRDRRRRPGQAVQREWQRVNDELDRANPVRVTDPERAGVPTLRRDPATGEYRDQIAERQRRAP